MPRRRGPGCRPDHRGRVVRPSRPQSAPARPESALPDGFVVRLNRHTRVLDDGAALVGGSPTRISRLKPLALRSIRGREITVTDAASRALAGHLLATGMADPVVDALPPVELALATVVIPVRDRPRQLDRLLRALGGALPVVVVDDASATSAGRCSRRPPARGGVAAARCERRSGGRAQRRTRRASVRPSWCSSTPTWLSSLPRSS